FIPTEVCSAEVDLVCHSITCPCRMLDGSLSMAYRREGCPTVSVSFLAFSPPVPGPPPLLSPSHGFLSLLPRSFPVLRDTSTRQRSFPVSTPPSHAARRTVAAHARMRLSDVVLRCAGAVFAAAPHVPRQRWNHRPVQGL